jgi:hypothetical protein
MRICKEVFTHFGLNEVYLWLKPYRIVSTSCNTGVMDGWIDDGGVDVDGDDDFSLDDFDEMMMM